jgi:tetrapyrrole methylase family protein/MazG family protein
MTMARIDIVGLGPGEWSQLTIGGLERLLTAEQVFLRTLVHPTVARLRASLRSEQRLHSFDDQYERALSFDTLYATIVDQLLTAALIAAEPIVYAVPGHPLVGERTVTMLLEDAPSRGVETRVFDAVSFLEPVCTALRVDPLSTSMALLNGAALLDEVGAALIGPWTGISPRLHPVGRPLLIGQVYDSRVASAVKLWLLERYPGTHEVQVVTAAGTSEQRLRRVALAELDRGGGFDHLTTVYVPALDPLEDVRGLGSLPFIVARLRADDGCPWDRKQTLDTLKPHLLEEAHELVAALDSGDLEAVVEELGDVLLQVVMLSQIGEEEATFDLPSVLETSVTKLVRRHPHVFGNTKLHSAEAVAQNWERIKATERGASVSALAGVPASMPSLIASQVMQRKAAALGFDWSRIEAVYMKVLEELEEVRGAEPQHTLEEAGDLLFALVSLCRHLHVDADEALRQANAKFRRRFEAVESLCRQRGLMMPELDAKGLDALWEEVKAAERVEDAGGQSEEQFTPSL